MQYVSILFHNRALVSAASAATLVAYALRRSGRAPWGKTEIEMICGAQETLLLARPLPQVRVRIAPYALPFLHEYFTDQPFSNPENML